MKLFKKAHWAKTHILIGLIVLVVIGYLNKSQQWIEIPTDSKSLIMLVIVGMVYSVIPDCDNPNSIINKYATILLGTIALLAYLNKIETKFGMIAVAVLILLRMIEHRTLIHSVIGAVIISIPLLHMGFIYFMVGVIAFISHIISDNDFSLGWEKDTRLW